MDLVPNKDNDETQSDLRLHRKIITSENEGTNMTNGLDWVWISLFDIIASLDTNVVYEQTTSTVLGYFFRFYRLSFLLKKK